MAVKLKAVKFKRPKGSLGKEFKAFVTRGSVIDMAVGVIMGSAFGAIVSAFTNILLSICTWGVPGGLKGFVTILPAINAGQTGIAGIGQTFGSDSASIVSATLNFAASKGVVLSGAGDANYATWYSQLMTNYTLHGTTYYFDGSALIDWGTFINAIISFLIIALSLFFILKMFTTLKEKRLAFEAELAKRIQDAPAPTAVPVAKPEPTMDEKKLKLLQEINDQVKTLNGKDVTK